MNDLAKIKSASDYLQSQSQYQPQIGLVLGSGLGSLADQIEAPEQYPYESIPFCPVSTVEGHRGQLVIGRLEGQTVMAMQGRLHYYEGYSMGEITFPIRLMKALGVEKLIVTSACGALNADYFPGALVLVQDHINWMGDNPLRGENFPALGPRFPDMSHAYTKRLLQQAQSIAQELEQKVFTGTHIGVSGPYFQTEAELKLLRLLGADTVGMSMIPEVIVAAHASMQVLGIACVTDMAVPGLPSEPVSHEKVMEVANRTRPQFIRLVKALIRERSNERSGSE